MQQAGNGSLLEDIRSSSFVPMHGRGLSLQPWVDGERSEEADFDASTCFVETLDLVEMTLDTLAPKFLELNVCTEDELDRARKNLEDLKNSNAYQTFSFPGG